HANQLGVERAPLVVARLRMEDGTTEGGLVLGVWHLRAEAGEPRELLPATLARRVGDERVVVIGEELERRRLAVLLAHEEERYVRREQDACGGDTRRRRRQAVALRP